MAIRIIKHNHRFAEEVLNSKLTLKKELEEILLDSRINLSEMSRPGFRVSYEKLFLEKGWHKKVNLQEVETGNLQLDFVKDRVGVEIGSQHASALGTSLLNFQVASDAALNLIDVAVYIVPTKAFQKKLKDLYNQKWDGSMTYERVIEHLPHYRSAIQVPIYIIGVDA